jgi:hypothetical protein
MDLRKNQQRIFPEYNMTRGSRIMKAIPVLTENREDLKSVRILYTEVSPDECLTETFRETFLEPACECCGSIEHPMLARTTEKFYHSGYICPIAIYKRLDKNYPKYPINLDFYACPRRFAEIHHYVNDERLVEALENYRMNSAARVDYSISQRFVDEVRRLCLEYQQSLVFKRDTVVGEEDEEQPSSPNHDKSSL